MTQPQPQPAIVDWLFERAFGGRQAVAVPGEHKPGPKGQFPAGVQDVIDHLAAYAVTAEPGGASQWVFLVGAPGNGKSEALKELAVRIGMPAPTDNPTREAPRDLVGDLPSGKRVKLINDASIPRAGVPDGTSLAVDLEEAFASVGGGTASLLLANVNRGVLVEELSHDEAEGAAAQLARDVLIWLNRVASGVEAGDPARSYYAHRTFDLEGAVVDVHAISLDAVSLFEPRPGNGSALSFEDGCAPSVAAYEPTGGIGRPPGSRSASVAADLLEKVTSQGEWPELGCEGCTASQLCPFNANVAWLREPNLAERFLETARASEVASNRRMTYRDLLGLLAIAILGPAEAVWTSGEHPCDWSRRLVGEAGSAPAAIANLARHRIYASLFPPPNPAATFWRRGPGAIGQASLYSAVFSDFGPDRMGGRPTPFASAFKRLDPAAAVSPWGRARAATIDAAEAMHIEHPVQVLLDDGIIPSAAVCELDHRLDAAVVAALSEPTKARAGIRQRDQQVRRWRATLLLRQVGLAVGGLADAEVVEAWLASQQGTLAGEDSGDLYAGLRALLVPGNGALRLAPFRPRTRAFTGTPPHSTLLMVRQGNELSVDLRAAKDGLTAVLRIVADGSADALPVPVDLDLAREALKLAQSGASGFTDLPDQAMARVERVQASLLSRGHSARGKAGLHVTDADGKVFVVRGTWGNLTLSPVTGGRL
jgi:hypothetical protein